MVLRVFWIMLGLCAEARPAAITQTRVVTIGFIFILSPYFFTGGPGLLAGAAGSRSWLKYVVVRQVATTLSPGAYWYACFAPEPAGLRVEATARFETLTMRSTFPSRSKKPSIE